MLDKEYEFYLKNQVALLKKCRGKVLVIKDEEIIGVYDDEVTAYKETVPKHKLGTFLIQKCVPEEETTQTFYSNVIFS